MSLLQRCKVCNYPIKLSEEVRCSVCNKTVHVNCTLAQHPSSYSTDPALALPRVCRDCSSLSQEASSDLKKCSVLPTGSSSTPLNTSHFAAIMEQFTVLGEAINKCNANLDILKTQITANTADIADIKQENAFLRDKVTSLETQLNNLDLHSSIAEVTERVKREKNLVLFGLPMQSSPEQDLSTAKNLLNQLAPQHNTTPVCGARIGKGNGTARPKPFKITLPNREDAIKVLQCKHNINKTEFPHVRIMNDLTPMQSRELSDLRLELARRQSDGEVSITIKYVKGVPKIVCGEGKAVQKRARDENNSPRQNKATKINRTSSRNTGTSK